MSVPFIAHTHHTRSDLLFQAIHLQPNPRDRRSIRDIARAENLPVVKLIRDLQDAVANSEPSGSEGVPPSTKAP